MRNEKLLFLPRVHGVVLYTGRRYYRRARIAAARQFPHSFSHGIMHSTSARGSLIQMEGVTLSVKP